MIMALSNILKPTQSTICQLLCVSVYKGGSCLPDGLLITLKPGADANQTLLKILDRRVWASGARI